MRGWGAAPSSRRWDSQCQLTFEGCELFWQVLFIAVLLVTEELLQRQADEC